MLLKAEPFNIEIAVVAYDRPPSAYNTEINKGVMVFARE
jgi:hypothetical protein